MQNKGTGDQGKGGLMKLYHAGKEEIREPDIYRGRKNADFGQGFYLTPDREFAYRWAYEDYVVNEYELDLTGLDVIGFSREADWFDYIFRNRRTEDTLAADVVTGPVANDTLYNTFGIISSGLLKPADALALLRIGPEFTQTAVKSRRPCRISPGPGHKGSLTQRITENLSGKRKRNTRSCLRNTCRK